jgi:hypothetical protein
MVAAVIALLRREELKRRRGGRNSAAYCAARHALMAGYVSRIRPTGLDAATLFRFRRKRLIAHAVWISTRNRCAQSERGGTLSRWADFPAFPHRRAVPILRVRIAALRAVSSGDGTETHFDRVRRHGRSQF